MVSKKSLVKQVNVNGSSLKKKKNLKNSPGRNSPGRKSPGRNSPSKEKKYSSTVNSVKFKQIESNQDLNESIAFDEDKIDIKPAVKAEEEVKKKQETNKK